MGEYLKLKEVKRITGGTGTIQEMLSSIGITDNSYNRFRSLVRNGRTVGEAIQYMKDHDLATTDLVLIELKKGINTCSGISKAINRSRCVTQYHLDKLMMSGVIECNARTAPYIYSVIRGQK